MSKLKNKKLLWGGRFREGPHPLFEEFSRSISFDKKLAYYDVLGSIAHAKMLAKQKIIKEQIAKKILLGLKFILKEIKNNRFVFDPKAEDIHTNIQNTLRKKIGFYAEFLHIGRSRNDQIALDLRMYLKDEIKDLIKEIRAFQKSLLQLAIKYKDLIIPGYTHLQRAQLISFPHYLLAYLEMLERDVQRLKDSFKRVDVLPLGSAALAGSSIALDRKFIAKTLGFSKISSNSIDAVSDRDFIIEMLAILAILSMHFSRFCEDLIIFSTQEFGFVELSDRFSTGSSIMPQKKNPDSLELIRAQTAIVYGNLFSLLVVFKALPLSYNRDMQEDKRPLFESLERIKNSLKLLGLVVKSLKLKEENLKKVYNDEFLFSTDIMEYLIKKGLSIIQAHSLVGKLVLYCLQHNKKFSELHLKDFKRFSPYFDRDVFKLLDVKESVFSKLSFGGTSPLRVKSQINSWIRRLNA